MYVLTQNTKYTNFSWAVAIQNIAWKVRHNDTTTMREVTTTNNATMLNNESE